MYPHERSLVQKMRNRPFVLLGVNSDSSREQLQRALRTEKITWRSWWDGGTSGPIATQWNVNGWPTLYLIDHKGIIRLHKVGMVDSAALDRAIEKLVAAAEK